MRKEKEIWFGIIRQSHIDNIEFDEGSVFITHDNGFGLMLKKENKDLCFIDSYNLEEYMEG